MTPSLQLTSIHLRVHDLARSVDFYARQAGFTVTTRTADRAELSTSPQTSPLLTLTEDRGAAAVPADSAGLFHAALLLPDRAALGRWLRQAGDAGMNFAGFSDHGVSEAIYFSDPDGNGLEFYTDRPPESWPRENGGIAMTTLPLALPDLLSAAAALPRTEAPLAGAHWGHLHIRVTNLDRSEKFYSDALGVTLTQRYGTSARFLAADGYHHHLGLNTWGHPRRPLPPGVLGLAEARFAQAGRTAEQHIQDPDGIALHLVPQAAVAAK
ncbi:MAG TPA: VOC family protein [Opitutaceae bacterium]|nr:VOC family protein [Opitutaceae bacterium]